MLQDKSPESQNSLGTLSLHQLVNSVQAADQVEAGDEVLLETHTALHCGGTTPALSDLAFCSSAPCSSKKLYVHVHVTLCIHSSSCTCIYRPELSCIFQRDIMGAINQFILCQTHWAIVCKLSEMSLKLRRSNAESMKSGCTI